jgi:hypothetical protein
LRFMTLVFIISFIISPSLAEESLGECDGIVWGPPVPEDVDGLGLEGLATLLLSARRQAATDPARAQLLARRVAYGIRLRLAEGTIAAADDPHARRVDLEAVELAASIWEQIEGRRPHAVAIWSEAVRLRLHDPRVRGSDRGLRHALARIRALEREFEANGIETEIEARRRDTLDPSHPPEARVTARLRLATLLRDLGDLDGAIEHAAVASADLLALIGPCDASLAAMLLEAELRARRGDPNADLVWLRAAVVHRELGEAADREIRRMAVELGDWGRAPDRFTDPQPADE